MMQKASSLRHQGVTHSIKKPKRQSNPLEKNKRKSAELIINSAAFITDSGPINIGSHVTVSWHGTTYKAVVKSLLPGKVKVHYIGWRVAHDEWIVHSQSSSRRNQEALTATVLVTPVETPALAPIANIINSPQRRSHRLSTKMSDSEKINNSMEKEDSTKLKRDSKVIDAKLDDEIERFNREVAALSDDQSNEDDDDDNNDDTGNEQDSEEDEMPEYEKMRRKNIMEREMMMQEIAELKSQVKVAMSPAVTTTRNNAYSKRGLAAEKREKEVLPRRKSARIAGGKVPEIERFAPELAPPKERQTKTLSMNTHSIKESFHHIDDETKTQLANDFVLEFSKNIQSAEPAGGETLSDPGYAQRLTRLQIIEEQVAKVVPDRIFSAAIHPTPHKVLASVGGKWGGLGLWDIEDTQSQEHGVYLFHPHTKPVISMAWDRFNDKSLVTTSYDGTCRIFDIEKLEHRVLYGDQDFIDNGGYLTSYAQIDAHSFLVAKGKAGCVGLVDTRTDNKSTVQEFQLFDRTTVRCIDVHPTNNNLLLAAWRTCCIFDIRNKGTGRLMDPICTLEGHGKTQSSASFSPLSGNKVITISFDDKLRLFDTSKLTGQIFGKATSHNNNTGRWLTSFKACWHPKHDDIVFTGSMDKPRKMEAWRAGTSLTRLTEMRGEDLGSICSIIAVHPTLDVVIGGNSSGRVHAFK